MQRALCYSFLVLLGVLLAGACGTRRNAEKYITRIDSASGALNSAIEGIRNIDTALISRCVERSAYYRKFIRDHFQDTIERATADNLRLYYQSSSNLSAFVTNRSVLQGRAALLNAQLSALKEDLASGKSLHPNTDLYIKKELGSVSELIARSKEQRELALTAIEQQKRSLQPVEDLIRNSNDGVLPALIKGNTDL
jgi:hypothetical protein